MVYKYVCCDKIFIWMLTLIFFTIHLQVQEKEPEKPEETKEANQKSNATGLLKYIGMEAGEGEGWHSVGCGSCCRLTCCLSGKNQQEEVHELRNQLVTMQSETRDQLTTIQMQVLILLR